MDKRIKAALYTLLAVLVFVLFVTLSIITNGVFLIGVAVAGLIVAAYFLILDSL